MSQDALVLLGHGGGGKLMHELLDGHILAELKLDRGHDGAVCRIGDAKVAFTTDSYVVRPVFFPGGDIGSLAVNGTVNDLAMCGARPLFLSLGLVLEEGFPVEDLRRVVRSARRAAEAAGVRIVTGDTKVVERGRGDGVYINTSGIGVIEHDLEIAPERIRPGDAVLLSGDLGRHGMAVMAAREGLKFETVIESDCAPLVEPVRALLGAGGEVHCLRDLTRGGLTGAVVELARAAGVRIELEEGAIEVPAQVRGACEILGLDPLQVACEGRFIAFVAGNCAAPLRRIGRVVEGGGEAILKTGFGTKRILDLPAGELLPRIC